MLQHICCYVRKTCTPPPSPGVMTNLLLIYTYRYLALVDYVYQILAKSLKPFLRYGLHKNKSVTLPLPQGLVCDIVLD